MKPDKLFWDNIATVYNKIFQNQKVYATMYSLMREALSKEMKVLEVGTASGLVARAVADTVQSVDAVDFSEAMIKQAKTLTTADNITFSVQDGNALGFADHTFDCVIISNVLHIVQQPEKMLQEIKRVLKADGLLIAPTFVWKETGWIGRLQKFVMKRKKFPVYSEWNSGEYIEFLENTGFSCVKNETLKWHFNICYAECKKTTETKYYR